MLFRSPGSTPVHTCAILPSGFTRKVLRADIFITSRLVMKISARNTFLVNPEGKIAHVWTGVEPGKHSAEVLAALGN